MNIIIPIAGANKPSAETEYIKSLQEIERKTVLQYVFESLQALKTDHFIVVIKREDASKYHLDHIVRLLRSSQKARRWEPLAPACWQWISWTWGNHF